ncbi:MAG: endonuclease/exonuclease/phosphatase family protein [Chitinophagales bacterium]
MGVKKGISTITGFIIWTIAIALGISLLGSYINPSRLPILGLLSLLIAPLILLNLVSLFYALLRKKTIGYLTFVILLLSIPQIKNLWGMHISPKQTTIASNSLKILTFNVRNFDLYNWSKNNDSRAEIFSAIKTADPDVICFQEFYSETNSDWDNIAQLKEELGLKYYYFTRELVLKEGRQWGIATFSKFPIIRYDEMVKSDDANKHGNYPSKAIFTDIALPTDTIRFINTHLASIYLNQDDYVTIEKLSEQEKISYEKSKPIIAKLRKAYTKRGKQVTKLKDFLNNQDQPHPIIISGDFNDLPTSYAYNSLSKNFQDAFLKTNWGTGATYNGLIPAMRIDFMLIDKKLNIAASEIIDLRISDHLPLLVTLNLGE